MDSLKATKFGIKLAFYRYLGTGNKEPLGPKFGSRTSGTTPCPTSARAIIFPSSLAGLRRLKDPYEVLRKEGTNCCQVLMGLCIQPSGPNPQPRISIAEPRSKSLGPVMSCKKYVPNSAVKECMATQNKPKKLGRPKSDAAS